ncbi:class I SAM-dependent methyltransferase [Kineococcus gynurae]|uniref:Class I SAM-dependent methyltransferase n=1 Tax=Kineococcus gynurae TaxID=452979 RepID=A0ABV5LN31_9ACTN
MPDDTRETTPSAPDYLHGYSAPVRRSHSWRTVANSAAYLEPRLRPGLDLLDVGCGVGTLTADLATRVAPGRVVGVDASAEVLTAAAAAAAAHGVDVELLVADATALPFAAASFDVVHLHQVLQHVPDPVAVLREARRVLRPGGTVAARDAVYASTVAVPEDPDLVAWRETYRRTARALGTEPDAGAHLARWARAAGFTDVVVSASAWAFSDPADRQWWASTWAERTDTVLRPRFAAGGPGEEDRTDAMVAAWRRWADVEDAWMSMTHGEVLLRA